MNIYTDGSYLKDNPSWHVGESAWKAEQVLKMLNKHHISPRTVCEIGCGPARILDKLSSEMDYSVIFDGYDISPYALALFDDSPHRDNVKFHLRDLAMSQSGEFYDLLMAVDVLEHIEDYFTFLRNIYNKAKLKLFHIPLDISVQSVIRSYRIMDLRRKVGHIHYFYKDTALATLRDSGYSIIDYFYTYTSLETRVCSIKSKLMCIPRTILFRLNTDFGVRLLGGASLMVLTE